MSGLNLRLSTERLWDSLMAMAAVGSTPEGGNNRPALSKLDGQARALLAQWGADIGLALIVDRLGNMALRREAGTPGASRSWSAATSTPSQPEASSMVHMECWRVSRYCARSTRRAP